MFPLFFLILEISSRSRRIQQKLEEEQKEEVDKMAAIQILRRDVLWRKKTKQSSSLWTIKSREKKSPSIDCVP